MVVKYRIVLFSTVAAFSIFGVSAHAEDLLLTLRMKGRADASPQLNAIFGHEVGGNTPLEKLDEARKTLKLETDPKLLMQESQKLQQAMDSQLRSVLVVRDESIVRSKVVLSEASALASEAFILAQQAIVDKERTETFAAASKRNKATLHAVLAFELSKQSDAKRRLWRDKISIGNTAAIDDVLANIPTLKARINDVRGVAARQIRDQMQRQLPDAIKKASSLSDDGRKDMEKDIVNGLPVLFKTADVINELDGSLKRTNALLVNYKGAAVNIGELSSFALERFKSGKLSKGQEVALRSAIQLGQQFLQGGVVSASDVSLALDRSGINLPNKEALLRTIDRLSDIRRPEALSQGLSDVKGYMELAKSLGIPLDKRVTRAIGTAQTATNIVNLCLSQNYIGAVSSVVGIFGGGSGGNDAAAESRQKELMDSLNEIKNLQIQTLQAIDNLSTQLTQSTEKIITKLDGIQESLTYLVSVSEQNDFKIPLTACRNFFVSAEQAGMQNGYFPSYSARKKHFENDGHSQKFQACSEMLGKQLMLFNADQDGEPSIPAALWKKKFTRDSRVASADASVSIFKYDKEQYFPMVAYAVIALDLGKGVDNEKNYTYHEPCSVKFIGALAAAPRSMHDVHYSRMRCDVSDGSTPSEGLKLNAEGFNGKFVSAGPLFDVPVDAGMVAELAKYSVMAQSYKSLAEDEHLSRLISEIDLAKGSTLRAPENLRSALDPVNIAIAQQTLLSGLYVAAFAADALKAERFGVDVLPPSKELISASANEGCAPNKYLLKETFNTTACMLFMHPEFARNVAMHLVMQDVSMASMTLDEYAALFDEGEATAHDVLVCFPSLQPYMIQRGKRWYIQVSSQLFPEPLLLPLPSASVLKAGTVSYPAIMRNLLESRAAMLQDLAAISQTSQSAAIWASAMRPGAIQAFSATEGRR